VNPERRASLYYKVDSVTRVPMLLMALAVVAHASGSAPL